MPGQRKLETILAENKLVSAEQLKQIAQYAHAVGIDLHEAILQKKIAPPEAVMMAYAESVGLPFVHFADISVDEEVVARIDPMTARQYSLVPVSIDQGYVLLVTTKPVLPDVEEELRMVFNLPLRCVICTPAELSAAITQYYPRGTARVAKAERSQVPMPQKEPEPVEPMSDEEKKDRLLKTFIAFNFSVAFVGLGINYLQLLRRIYNMWYYYPSFALLCVIVGIIVGGVVWKKLSR
jgi:hypothetical protein